MGYRSEVAITMKTKDYNTMVRRAKALKNQVVYNLINNADIYETEEDKIITLYWGWIKWYSEYYEISWIKKFIRSIDSTFVRLGEDVDDTEEEYYNKGHELQEYAYYTRNIEISGKKKEKQNKEEDLI